jgi:hypothetical protein
LKRHINGNVQGLPNKFPIKDATTLTRNNHAKNIPIKKCKPNKGVKAAVTPKVKPNAILCGLPGSLFNLKEIYLIILFQPFFGHNKLKNLDIKVDF